MNFGYTGHYRHAASNLYLAPYRAYDPATGRWINRDPFEDAEFLPEGPNLYAYVGNNPINYVDPTGEWAWLLRGGKVVWEAGKKIGPRVWNKAKEVWNNTNIDGPLGTRVCQFRWKNNPSYGWTMVPGQVGPHWHYHRPPNMKLHRPYEGGW